MTTATGGNRYVLQSDAGKLTIAGTFAWLAANNRSLLLQGDGDGEFAAATLRGSAQILRGARPQAGTRASG